MDRQRYVRVRAGAFHDVLAISQSGRIVTRCGKVLQKQPDVSLKSDMLDMFHLYVDGKKIDVCRVCMHRR